MLIYCIYKMLLQIVTLYKLDRIVLTIFLHVRKYEYQSKKMYQIKFANFITFEAYVMCRLSELRTNKRHREYGFSLHVHYKLYIGPGRTNIKLNKFQFTDNNAKFVLNPLNRVGDETYIRPHKNTKDCNVDGFYKHIGR